MPRRRRRSGISSPQRFRDGRRQGHRHEHRRHPADVGRRCGECIDRQDGPASRRPSAWRSRTPSGVRSCPISNGQLSEVSVAARLSTDKVSTNETIFNPESKVECSTRTIKETEVSQDRSGQEAHDGPAEPARRERSRRSGRKRQRRQSAPRRTDELRNFLEDDPDDQRRLPDQESVGGRAGEQVTHRRPARGECDAGGHGCQDCGDRAAVSSARASASCVATRSRLRP